MEPACSAHMMCGCARKHNRGRGGEGGETDLVHFAIKCLMCCEMHRHTNMCDILAYVCLCSDNSRNMCDCCMYSVWFENASKMCDVTLFVGCNDNVLFRVGIPCVLRMHRKCVSLRSFLVWFESATNMCYFA